MTFIPIRFRKASTSCDGPQFSWTRIQMGPSLPLQRFILQLPSLFFYHVSDMTLWQRLICVKPLKILFTKYRLTYQFWLFSFGDLLNFNGWICFCKCGHSSFLVSCCTQPMWRRVYSGFLFRIHFSRGDSPVWQRKLRRAWVQGK